MRRVFLLLCLLCCTLMASSSDSVRMRWRVFCDEASQSSFRFPYDYQIPDQYAGVLLREGKNIAVPVTADAADPKALMAKWRAAWRDPKNADILHRGGLVEELEGVDAEDPAALVKQVSDGALEAVEELAYYAPEDDLERPFADPGHAPEGVQAWRATGPKHSGRLLRWTDDDDQQRYALLIATGKESAHDNAAIFDSLEILVGRRSPQTWRAMMSLKARVLDPQGVAVRPSRRSDPTSWEQCWEVETPHYHITCTAGSGKALYYARLMEELYELYTGVYNPDNIPPFKMEVHIFDTRERFFKMAAQRGFALPSSTVLGFFSPTHLCVYGFDKVNAGSMTTENVLAHEASHQFLHTTCNGSRHVPTWINEGLAVYFESADFSRGKPKWKAPRQRLGQLRAAYGRDKRTLMPLENYLGHYGPIGALQYAEVYAMTHFWVFGSKSGAERFKEYWHALKAGENGTEAFERIFMADLIATHGSRAKAFQVWEEALLRYVDKNYPAKKP